MFRRSFVNKMCRFEETMLFKQMKKIKRIMHRASLVEDSMASMLLEYNKQIKTAYEEPNLLFRFAII